MVAMHWFYAPIKFEQKGIQNINFKYSKNIVIKECKFNM